MSDAFMEGAHMDHDRLAMLARMSVGGDAIVLLVDPETSRIVEASPAAEEFYGWSREELLAMTTDDLGPSSMKHVRMDKSKALASGGHVHVVPHRTRSGEDRMVEVRARPIQVGKRDLFVATISDVSELRSALAALEASQQRYQRLVELSPDALFVEADKRFAYLNPAAVRLFGAHDASELIGKRILEFIHPDFRTDVDQRMESLPQGFNDSSPTRRQYVRVDGTVIDVEVRAVAIEYDGRPAAQVLVRDIGARVAAEAVMAWNAAIVESSDDAVYSENVNGIVLNWNRAAERIYGYTADQIVGSSVYDTLIPEDLAEDNRDRLRTMWLEDKPEHFETQRLNRNGKLIDVAVTLSPIHNAEGLVIGISAIGRDISERKQLEQAKDEFLSLVSHELRTPLTTVIGYAQLLADPGRHFTPNRRAQVGEKMLERSKDMLDLIEELLDATRLRSGELQLQPVPMDPGLLLAALPESFPETDRLRLRIVSDGKMRPVMCDPKWLSIAVGNLVANALKFSPAEEPVLLQILQDDGLTSFQVHDGGPGIDPDLAERLFDRFVQGDMSSTRQHEGAGLGLYIVRRVAELHGGTATYDPRLGGGSSFTVSLPTG